MGPLAALGCGGGSPSIRPPPGGAFLRASGTAIVDGDGTPVFLKGVSFGNEVWANAAIPDDHAEIDFQRLADMGANSTRFLMNHVTFEDDAAPYVYKDAGWAWIDQNVAWAKAHGIRLILNMHVPEGGFQSDGNGGALWSDPTNQDRLTALWTEIARRYAGEPIIAGYGLVNEPEPLTSVQQWKQLAARLTTAIRSVDTNHIVFVERAIAVAGNFAIDIGTSFPTLDDPNVVYEFHFYDPYEYTSQLEPWNNMPDGGVYPDPSLNRTKDGLAQMMEPYLAWGAGLGVPLLLGEFGVYKACFADNKGGLSWVSDAYDVATGAGAAGGPPVAALSYHQYHEDNFALYYGSSGPVDPNNANQPLIDLLTTKLHAAP